MKRRSLFAAVIAALCLPFKKLFRRKRGIVLLNPDYGMSVNEVVKAQPLFGFSIGGTVRAREGNVITDVRLDYVSIDWKVVPTTDKTKALGPHITCPHFKV